MSLYIVLVDGDLKHLPPVWEHAAPKVVAHNLSREAAGRLEALLSNDSVEGQPTGWVPYVCEYKEPHANTEPDNCLECEEIALEHCKHLLYLIEQEKAKRLLN